MTPLGPRYGVEISTRNDAGELVRTFYANLTDKVWSTIESEMASLPEMECYNLYKELNSQDVEVRLHVMSGDPRGDTSPEADKKSRAIDYPYGLGMQLIAADLRSTGEV